MKFDIVRAAAIVLTLLGLAASVHGESPHKKRLFSGVQAEAVPPRERSLASGCPESESGWTAWRENAIAFLLEVRKPTRKERAAGQRNDYLHPEDVATRSSQIAQALDQCEVVGKPAPEAVIGALRMFTNTQRNANYLVPNPQHQFGHGPAVTDDEYLCRAQPALELPCLLRSPAFLDKISAPARYHEAHADIQAQNAGQTVNECRADGTQWATLIYRSQFLGTPDEANAMGRFLVIVPAKAEGPKPADTWSRWIQFGIWLPEDLQRDPKKASLPIRNVSVVAVASDTNTEKRFDALVDWWRCRGEDCAKERTASASTLARNGCTPKPQDTSGRHLQYLVAVNGATGNCQECHKMMPLSIHPKQFHDHRAKVTRHRVYEFQGKALRLMPPAAAASAVRTLNESIARDYRRAPIFETGPGDHFASWRNYGETPFGAAPEEYGLPPRSLRSIESCASGLPPESKKQVLEAMNCADCHDGKKYGALNYPQATEKRRSAELKEEDGLSLVPNLIESHILSGAMPLEVDNQPVNLSKEQRLALYRCLSEEYFDPKRRAGLFVDWLRNEEKPSTFMPRAHAGTGAMSTMHGTLELATGSDPASDFVAVRCHKCHSTQRDQHTRDGPSLFGVVGRPLAGTNYPSYSPALRELGQNKGLHWDAPSLMEFLVDQDKFVSARLGTTQKSTMSRRYPDEALRRRLVEYLETLK